MKSDEQAEQNRFTDSFGFKTESDSKTKTVEIVEELPEPPKQGAELDFDELIALPTEAKMLRASVARRALMAGAPFGNQNARKENNQLEPNEQTIAHAKLETLKADKETEYAKAYNQDSVKTSDVGFKSDGWLPKKYHNDEGGRLSHVSTENLHANAQDGISKAGLKSYIARSPDPKKEGWPEIAKVGDKHYVLSGHTRIGAAMLGGRETVRAKVFNYNEAGYPIK